MADFPQLGLADVYAALAYYHDHREQIDKDIREDEEYFQRMKAQTDSGLLDRRRAQVPMAFVADPDYNYTGFWRTNIGVSHE